MIGLAITLIVSASNSTKENIPKQRQLGPKKRHTGLTFLPVQTPKLQSMHHHLTSVIMCANEANFSSASMPCRWSTDIPFHTLKKKFPKRGFKIEIGGD